MKVITPKEASRMPASQMTDGQFGQIVGDGCVYKDEYVLKVYDAVVLLSNPMITWSWENPGNCDMHVVVCPPGTKITLISEV
jgi:hypothetical protein